MSADEPMDTEAILRSFHRRWSGAGPRVFGSGRLGDGRNSYERLADSVSAPSRVLDLACGDGSLAAVLVARGHDVIGLDMSPEELAVARARLPSSVRLFEGRAQALPLEDASLDAVLTHMALMLMNDVEQVVEEIARVLVPGGVLAAIVGRDVPDGGAMTLFRDALRLAMQRDGLRPRFGDPRTGDPDGLRALLAPRFVDTELEDLVLHVDVRRDELWSFFETAFYPVDMLGEDAKRELRGWVEANERALAPDGIMRWRFSMRWVSARRAR